VPQIRTEQQKVFENICVNAAKLAEDLVAKLGKPKVKSLRVRNGLAFDRQ
jgi:hypothetical protein